MAAMARPRRIRTLGLAGVVLAVLFGLWCLGAYGRDGGAANLASAIVAFALSFGLVAYDSWFLRKTRALR